MHDKNLNDKGSYDGEQAALPDPMQTPELTAPKVEQPVVQQVVIKKTLLSHPFVASMFLVAFFLTSFFLGTYAERNEKLAQALGSNATGVGAQAAQAGGDQVLGLQDGQKVEQGIEIDEARVKGSPNAKVTIIEYSDFECPFCASFYSSTYKELLEKYVNSGRVRIAFKDFPLSFHQNAQGAHEASRCAAEQGKFWEMHDKLFENQKALSVANYKAWAREIGLNSGQFDSCVDSQKYKDAVQAELAEGIELGVQGTPSFLINGVALVGAQPIAAFEKFINEQLNN